MAALELIRRLQRDEFLQRQIAPGQERVPGQLSALSCELLDSLEHQRVGNIAGAWYPKNPRLAELLGVHQSTNVLTTTGCIARG